MDKLAQQAELMHKIAEKILKILAKLDETTRIAVINYIFLLLILNDKKGPIVAKAMTATFLNNVMNSINEYFYTEDDECEPVH